MQGAGQNTIDFKGGILWHSTHYEYITQPGMFNTPIPLIRLTLQSGPGQAQLVFKLPHTHSLISTKYKPIFMCCQHTRPKLISTNCLSMFLPPKCHVMLCCYRVDGVPYVSITLQQYWLQSDLPTLTGFPAPLKWKYNSPVDLDYLW